MRPVPLHFQRGKTNSPLTRFDNLLNLRSITDAETAASPAGSAVAAQAYCRQSAG